MKKILLTISIAILACCSYAQTNTFPSNGNVGIGTTTPGTSLDVNGAFRGISDNSYLGFDAGTDRFGLVKKYGFFGQLAYGSAATFTISQSSGTTIAASNTFTPRLTIDNSGNVGIGTSSPNGALSLGSSVINKKLLIYDDGNTASGFGQANSELRIFGASAGTNHISFGKYTLSSDSFTEQMRIDNNGNLSIRASNSQGYMFAVAGTAIATSMTVKAYANWPDYVFKPKFHLPTLTEVKTFIDQNQHLPEIPSAAQIEKDGLNLGEMNKVLVKKVEELTLYLIEKDKEIKDQKLNNIQLSERLKNQQQEIDLLKTQVETMIKTKTK